MIVQVTSFSNSEEEMIDAAKVPSDCHIFVKPVRDCI